MGWNQGYGIFEKTVVQTYDAGKLDKEILSILMEPYRGTDIDSGGKVGLVSKDGLEVEQIVIKIFGGELPEKPELPADYKDWTEAQSELNDAYYESIGIAFDQIADNFGWC